MSRPRPTPRTIEEFTEDRTVRRLAGALDALDAALADDPLEPPPPLQPDDLIPPGNRGVRPKLPLEALELARQVYYLQHANFRECARAIIAAGLSDTDDVVQVTERLQTFWRRMRWQKRSSRSMIALRDVNNGGGLYRGDRVCKGKASGNGRAPKGKPCELTPVNDSDYCFQHDPRPEYAEIRRRQGEILARSREADMVPVEPFQRWCERKRRAMLADAQAAGTAHPNQRGWRLLADLLHLDASSMGRIMDGRHNGGRMRKGEGPSRLIRATTVARYLEPAGVTFQDVYGYDPPEAGFRSYLVCPKCSGRKEAGSETCRACFEATRGELCTYVNLTNGVRCNVHTKHESGVCQKHRRVLERRANPRPRPGREPFLTPPMVIAALGEYRDVPVHQWVSARLWQYDAAGVRSAYLSQKSLVGALVKYFAKRGWRTADDAARAYDELVAEHGPQPFPTEPVDGLADVAMIPAAPFVEWLTAHAEEAGSYKALAQITGASADKVSKWIRGVGVGAGKTTVRRFTVERALEGWNRAYGTTTTFTDLYGAA